MILLIIIALIIAYAIYFIIKLDYCYLSKLYQIKIEKNLNTIIYNSHVIDYIKQLDALGKVIHQRGCK